MRRYFYEKELEKAGVRPIMRHVAVGQPALAGQRRLVSDVPWTAWYRRAVNELADMAIIAGTGGDKFSPNATLTRGAFVTMLGKSVLESWDISQYKFRGGFKDVSTGHWANPYVNWASETGVATGYEDNTFRPDRAVTRQEMAVMVKNFARSTGKKFPAINDPVTFRDQGQIASWAKESVALCQRADILNGDAESGRFRPGERAPGPKQPPLYTNI